MPPKTKVRKNLDTTYLQTGSGVGDAGADEGGGVFGIGSGERAEWSAGQGVEASLDAKNLSVNRIEWGPGRTCWIFMSQALEFRLHYRKRATRLAWFNLRQSLPFADLVVHQPRLLSS